MMQWNIDPAYQLEKERQRAALRQAANRCGVMLLLFLVGMYAVSFGAGFFMPVLQKLIPDQSYLMDLLNLALNIVVYLIITPLLLWYFNKKSGIRTADFLRFPDMPKKSVAKLVLMGLGVIYCANLTSTIFLTIISNLLRQIGIEMYFSDVSVNPNLLSIFVTVLSTAILAPFFEELLVRCGLVGTVGRFGGVFTAISTGILFGFMHTNLQQVFFAAMMGIYAGFISYRTRSVWPAIFLHFAVNATSAIQVVLLSLSPLGGFTAEELVMILQNNPMLLLKGILPMAIASLLSTALMIFGIIGIVTLVREIQKNPSEFSLPQEKRNSLLTMREKMKTFFTAPGVIAFLSLSILLSFLNAFFAG